MLLDFKIIFAVLAVVFNLIAFYVYIKDVFIGKTKPHIYTWLIWTITQGTATFGLWYGGGGLGAIELTIGTCLVFFVFLFSIFRGTKNITKIDTVFLILSFIAIFIWWQLQSLVLAVIMVSIIDMLGYFPSFRKTWMEPYSETISTWLLFSLGNIFSIMALTKFNALTLTYLITISVLNMAVVGICLYRRNKVVALN